jgi:hypothetical protein
LKKKTYKEKETLDKRGTKRYQERLVEAEEAEREIKQYKQVPKDDAIDNDERPLFP